MNFRFSISKMLVFFNRTSRVTFCELLTTISSPTFSRNARPPSTDRKALCRPTLPTLTVTTRLGATTMLFASMACAQIGVMRKFFADGSTIGPPADME